MRGRFAYLFFIVCFVLAPSLFARGKKEAEKKEPHNTDFVLCITAFDVSALPPGQQVLGPILQRELARELETIHHRIRSGDELSRYEELAWTAALHGAAEKLAEKRAERDKLLYQGTPGWKYRRELKRITKELKDLEEAYGKAETERPLIAEKPLFKISGAAGQDTAGNAAAGNGAVSGKGEITFPPPPPRGGEEAFLRARQADAFMAGTFRMVYGRIYAEFRIFTRGASFTYEDSIIFSSEDLGAASDELKLRFIAALVNAELFELTVNTEPEDARILVNGRFGRSGETVYLPPGPVKVEAGAEDHQSEVRELDGESEETLFVVLKPFTMEALGINLPGNGASVYMGSLYMGGSPPARAAGEIPANPEAEGGAETVQTGVPESENGAEIAEAEFEETAAPPAGAAPPVGAGLFSVYVPLGQYRYIRIDTEDGLTGEAIVKGGAGGSLENVRILTLEPRKLPGRDDKPVEEKRRKFYGAFGRFWIALPAAFFINGVFQTYANNSARSQEMYDRAVSFRYVSIGAWSVAGVFLIESLVRMGIYIHSASKESIPLWE